MRKSVNEILEWREPLVSFVWLVYIGLLLIYYPSWVPTAVALHVGYNTLSMNEDLKQFCRGKINDKIASIYRAPPVSAQPVSAAAPRTASASSGDASPGESRRSTMSALFEKGGSALREAAASAVDKAKDISQQMRPSQVPPTAPVFEIWENQRRNLGGNVFNASNLLVMDRPRWSDESGKIPLEPMTSSEWKIDVNLENSDENGWQYALRWSGDWHSSFGRWDFVRRRRWIPAMTGGVTPDQASPREVEMNRTPPRATPSRSNSVTDVGEDLLKRNPSDVNPPKTRMDSILQTISGVVNELSNSAGMEDESDLSEQPKLMGLGAMFHDIKAIAFRAQCIIGESCDVIETYLAMFSWRDDLMTTVVCVAVVALAVVMWFVPFNVLVYLVVLSYFHAGFRRGRWRKLAVDNVMYCHVAKLIPSGTTKSLSGLEAQKVANTLNRRLGISVSVKVIMEAKDMESLARWICAQFPATDEQQRWMRRDWIENFLDHVPPDVSEEAQIFMPDADSKAQQVE